MIEVLSKTTAKPDGAGNAACLLVVRINGKPRSRMFRVSDAYRSVTEDRQVGRKRLWCDVRDAFLRSELAVIARAFADTNPVH